MDENEKKYEPIPVEVKKGFFSSLKKKDMILGLLIAVLILWAYFAGQQSTFEFQQFVRDVCPGLNVTGISPFGMSFQKQRGGYVGEGNFDLGTFDNVSIPEP